MFINAVYLESNTSACMAGLPFRFCTKYVRCPAETTISQGEWLLLGWAIMKAASPQSRAASMSGTLWPILRPQGLTRQLCFLISKLYISDWWRDYIKWTKNYMTNQFNIFLCNRLQPFIKYVNIFFVYRPNEGERTECMIKAKLRNIMMFRDLENITSKEVYLM